MKTNRFFALYADPASRVSSAPLDREIQRRFPHTPIEYVDRHDLLKPSLYRNMGAFFLPGIQGEYSYYPDHVGPAAHLLQDYLRTGGIYFGECAGACEAGMKVMYQPSWTAHREREDGLLGIFNGICFGPPAGIGVDGNDPRFFRGLTTANLVTDVFEDGRVVPIAYSSGPTFIPHAGQGMSVHARYADVAGMPPAVISYAYGRGLVFLLGPVPQYGSQPLTGLAQLKAMDDLLRVMQPFEAERIRFFDSLMDRIARHMARRMDKTPAFAVQSVV